MNILAHPLGVMFALAAASYMAQSSGGIYRMPESFSELPRQIKTILIKERCRIPQGTIQGKVVAINVVSGELAKKGQTDWAVLCSRDGNHYIRVFWGGVTSCPSRIDKGKMMSGKETAQGLEFDRAIDTVDKEFIDRHYNAYGGPKPPTITHLGIDYAYLEKSSVVHYCHRGKWLELTGAD
jgi:hypothetical protein